MPKNCSSVRYHATYLLSVYDKIILIGTLKGEPLKDPGYASCSALLGHIAWTGNVRRDLGLDAEELSSQQLARMIPSGKPFRAKPL